MSWAQHTTWRDCDCRYCGDLDRCPRCGGVGCECDDAKEAEEEAEETTK